MRVRLLVSDLALDESLYMYTPSRTLKGESVFVLLAFSGNKLPSSIHIAKGHSKDKTTHIRMKVQPFVHE